MQSDSLRLFATASDAYSQALSEFVQVVTTYGGAADTASAAANLASTVLASNLTSALAVADAGAAQQAISSATQLLTISVAQDRNGDIGRRSHGHAICRDPRE